MQGILLAATLVACGAGSQAPATVPDAHDPPAGRDGAADVTSAATYPLSDFSSATACNTVVNDARVVAFTAGTCTTGAAQIPTTESYVATSSELILSATQGSVVALTTTTRAGCP